jgi:hypothetical protein
MSPSRVRDSNVNNLKAAPALRIFVGSDQHLPLSFAFPILAYPKMVISLANDIGWYYRYYITVALRAAVTRQYDGLKSACQPGRNLTKWPNHRS